MHNVNIGTAVAHESIWAYGDATAIRELTRCVDAATTIARNASARLVVWPTYQHNPIHAVPRYRQLHSERIPATSSDERLRAKCYAQRVGIPTRKDRACLHIVLQCRNRVL